jgi:thiol-disulfide isomerase/thioredoxin
MFKPSESMIEVDSKQGLDAELAKTKKLLVLFYASWCNFCKRFIPIFKAATADFKLGGVVHARIDYYDNSLWEEYDIGAVPTVLYFVDGKVYKRLDGKLGLGLSEQKLSKFLSEINF